MTDIDLDSTLGGFAELLGIRLSAADGDRVAAGWTARPDLHQPYGILHGGVHCSVVETLASIGGALWLGDRGQVVGVHNSTDFLRQTRDGDLTSVATPIHRGRLQQLWLVETEQDSKVVARGQVRLQNLSPQA